MARERKVVSVLFVDLVGFTAQSESADPEDVDALLRGYHGDVRREIERYGGTVEKFIGDAVVALFGAPVVHEDDPERAVLAALRILEVTDLDVRIAVNTGEVLVDLDSRPDHGEGMVTGDAVNTASRLQSAAPVRGVLVGEATWAATPFVGRRRELELLQQLFERSLEESGVQLVTVVGEPGAGKTRLVGELRSWVDDRPELVLWRQGRCLPYGDGIAYWPLGEAVKAQAGILESDTAAETAAKLDMALEGMPEAAWLRARLGPLVGLESAGSATRDESFAAWRSFFEELAAGGPLVLVVEDLHWAEGAMLEFVDYLVEWSSAAPILVIGTARPELFEHHPGWGGGMRNATTISLSSLSDVDTARLVAALMERSVLPAETQALLLERAGGNPLFAEEFVRMLRDRGVGDAAVPGNVQALIAARLDTLEPDRKRLIQDAAVVGKVFWAGAVASIGAADPAQVETALRELVRKELVKPARLSSVAGQREYVFWHALVRDVAYGQIPRADRIHRHVAAAEWIDEMAGDRAGDHAEILAHHYLSAMELAEATAAVDSAPLRNRAIDQLLVAAGTTMNADSAAATRLLLRAIDLQASDDPRLAPALTRASLAAFAQGELEQARSLIDAALDAARDLGSEIALGHAMAVETLYRRDGSTEGPRRRQETLAQAVELLERHPPGPELATALTLVAGTHMLEERPEEAIKAAERALPVAERFGDPSDVTLTLAARGWGRSDLGDAGGLDDLRRALEIELETGDAWAPVAAINLAGLVWAWEGPAPAAEIYQLAVREAERRRQTTAWSKRELAWVLADLGRWDEALTATSEVLTWARDNTDNGTLAMAASTTAMVHVRRGATAAAAALVDEALDAIRASTQPQVRQPGLIAAAEVRLAQGRPADARDLLAELTGSRFGGMFTCMHLPAAVATALAAGRRRPRAQADRRGAATRAAATHGRGAGPRPGTRGGRRPHRSA